METFSPSENDKSLENSPGQTESLSPRGMSAMQGNDETSVLAKPDNLKMQETETPNEWKDWGIVDVPVDDLPDPDGVSSPDDFNHHISWEDARSATEQLPKIQQEVAAGKMGDDFSAEDRSMGLDYQYGRRRVYDLYYSQTDPVQVDKIGAQYFINSGRHRIFAAKELGLGTIPARVKEKVEK